MEDNFSSTKYLLVFGTLTNFHFIDIYHLYVHSTVEAFTNKTDNIKQIM
jgi:hypothetical protein